MRKLLEWLRDYGIILLVFVLLFNSMQTCNGRREADKAYKIIQNNTKRIDSLVTYRNEQIALKDELQLMMEIQNLQQAKMVLYDWNSVVRTATRPDDRMHWYDQEITKTQKALDEIRRLKH